MDAYLVAVIILLLLAIGDLIVGVSNDAVNFLVSAVGSRVAPRRVILGIAAAGVFVGAVFSSGMMEVARKGIFDPSFFSFADIMVIFLAVMITDILLLDLYNSLGLPTSTTVSIIFELLGAAVVIGWLVIGRGETDATSVLELINQGKVVEIIAGIFLSVALAFSIGALVQWISRLLFTFHLDRRMRRYGALFAGIAITFIAYFMLVKGLKGSALASDELLGWVKANTTMLMALVFVVVTLAVFALQRTLGLHPLKLVVLAGTFTLAMAFAGNDLVNFVGVPITAFQSYELWKASGVDAHGFMMDQLAGQVRTPTLLLLIAGLVMTVTLWVSGKARKVTDTAVNLGRQGKGEEKFRSHALARAIVRRAQWSNRIFSHVLGRRNRILIRMRFRNHGLLVDGGPAFDLVRASVNLMVASVLIAIGTNLKLPLSTTYVSFMVAMGASLADRAWGAESAEYRVAGVLNVIGGWLLTAVGAFVASGFVALLIHYGGIWTAVVLFLVAMVFLYLSHRPGHTHPLVRAGRRR